MISAQETAVHYHRLLDYIAGKLGRDIQLVQHEKTAWITRLRQEGKLEGAMVSEAVPVQRTIFYVLGYAAVAAGLFLLIGALINVRNISW